MRPATTGAVATTNTTVGFQRWNSPIPYLLSGLALTLGLIAFALAILGCSASNLLPTHQVAPMNNLVLPYLCYSQKWSQRFLSSCPEMRIQSTWQSQSLLLAIAKESEMS
ncbi:hypothetical protein CsSME_00004041 [Camellia sinensis var. sinensis]